MSELYDIQELVAQTGLSERTVRYYLAKVLNVPGGVRGRKMFYSRETLDQLKLTKQVLVQPYDPKRGEIKPSLLDFQRWLASLSTEDISKMVAMPYSIKPKQLLAASARPPAKLPYHASNASRLFRRPSKSRGQSGDQNGEDDSTPISPAVEYPDKDTDTNKPPAKGSQLQRQWRSFRFGNDLQINTRQKLTPEKLRQLKLAGQLLQSVLRG